MTLRFQLPFARLTGFALSVLLLAIVMPTLTSSFVGSPHAVGGCAERVQARLFFGLHRPTGTVSQEEWEMFLADTVTPRFPDGLTVLRASGQWRGAGDQPEQEPSRVVEIVYDDSPDARRRLDEIVAIYKNRFQQESVMVARSRGEVCF
jgi:hypothetical protein